MSQGTHFKPWVTLEFSLSDRQDYQTEVGLYDVETADENFCKERPPFWCT